jgi:hypothetical protein
VAGGGEGHRVFNEIGAHDLAEPGGKRAFARDGRPVRHHPVGAFEDEVDFRIGHGEALDHIGDRRRFGADALEEFAAGGDLGEEVAHLDDGAAVHGLRHGAGAPAIVDNDGKAGFGIGRTRSDGETRHRADGGQGFATKAEGADIVEIVFAKFGGRVALDR